MSIGWPFLLVEQAGVEPARMNRSRGYSPVPFLLGVRSMKEAPERHWSYRSQGEVGRCRGWTLSRTQLDSNVHQEKAPEVREEIWGLFGSACRHVLLSCVCRVAVRTSLRRQSISPCRCRVQWSRTFMTQIRIHQLLEILHPICYGSEVSHREHPLCPLHLIRADG